MVQKAGVLCSRCVVQRRDAVAMNVLDPFEVAEICVWLLVLGYLNEKEQGRQLDRTEFTVFEMVK